MRRFALTVAFIGVALAVGGAAAQGPAPPAFDAVIRVNDSGNGGGGSTALRNGRWTATNLPVTTLLGIAWDIPSERVLNAPDWARLTKYDVGAVSAPEATPEQLPQMLAAMLRERFKASAHVEQRQFPVYNLVLARPDGRLGPDLKRSPIVNCADRDAIAALKPAPRPCRFSWTDGTLTGGGTSLETIARLLDAGRPVFDKTGLTGLYDFDLKWAPGLGPDAGGNATSIFTAVQDQLGLKLESATAPLDVLIVDHLERPTPN